MYIKFPWKFDVDTDFSRHYNYRPKYLLLFYLLFNYFLSYYIEQIFTIVIFK